MVTDDLQRLRREERVQVGGARWPIPDRGVRKWTLIWRWQPNPAIELSLLLLGIRIANPLNLSSISSIFISRQYEDDLQKWGESERGSSLADFMEGVSDDGR